MKVVILSGCEISTSRTAQVTNKIKEYLEKKIGVAEILAFDQQNVKAKHCTGCCNCFYKGRCSLENTDGVVNLKNALLSADLIIIISPVYFHQVSGTMKVFIDRLSYWTHLMRLVGKMAITVSVSSNNGNEYVNFYLNKFMSALGTIVLKEIPLLMDEDSPEEAERKLITGIDTAFEKINKYEDLRVSQNQEIIFSVMKKKYQNAAIGTEYEFWRDNHYFDYPDFQSLWNEHFLNKENNSN